MKLHVKKGDTVKLIAGSDKGKTGRITEVDRDRNRVFVEGVNIRKKHLKARVSAANPEGGIIKQEASVHISNVQLIDPKGGKATRIGRKEENGKTVRFAKKSGTTID